MVDLTLFDFLRKLPKPSGAVTTDDLAKDTRALSEALRPAWEQSIFGSASRDHLHEQLIIHSIKAALEHAQVNAPEAILEALIGIVRRLVEAEPLFNMNLLPLPEGLSYAEIIAERSRLLQLRELLSYPDTHIGNWQKLVGYIVGTALQGLPSFHEGGVACETELVDIKADVAEAVELIVEIVIGDYSNELTNAGFLGTLCQRLFRNVMSASGLTEAEWRQNKKRPLMVPTKQRGASPRDLVELYLQGTPIADLFKLSWPVSIPQSARFEHHWIVAGSGHGKTQTLQYLIAQDFDRVAAGEASVIVIDSQGDLIKTISGLKAFAEGGALENRLCLIDPTDIEYPVALNLFDVSIDRISAYSPLDRERLINSVLELYDFVLGSLLSAEFTQKQGIIFRYIMRLMLHIPDSNIQTLRQLMEPGASERFKPYIAQLTGTARAFFENEFNSKQFEETKRQVARRLYGILENQTFERMFSHPRNKLDLFKEMNAGRVILINTAKELLKQTGTEILGRFFIAMIAQAAQERAVLPKGKRLPCFVYIDECQDYVDANVALDPGTSAEVQCGAHSRAPVCRPAFAEAAGELCGQHLHQIRGRRLRQRRAHAFAYAAHDAGIHREPAEGLVCGLHPQRDRSGGVGTVSVWVSRRVSAGDKKRNGSAQRADAGALCRPLLRSGAGDLGACGMRQRSLILKTETPPKHRAIGAAMSKRKR